MRYTILVIDDDEPIHFMAKNLLGKEFNLLHAKDSQEAIDILAKSPVNLILSDIHMPGLTGLEFLESIREDKEKSGIPILIMTNLPTIEKEKKALDLGAADFIKKERFNNDPEGILEIVRMKIVTDVKSQNIDDDLEQRKNKLVMKLMESAIKGSFTDTADVLCGQLSEILDSKILTFYEISNQKPNLITAKHNFEGEEIPVDSFVLSSSFQYLMTKKEPYLSNHVYNGEIGSCIEFSAKNEIPAEIGIPLFSANEKAMLMNNMNAPASSEVFGMLIIKRSKLFSSNEFDLISRLVTQSGSILWRLYQQSK